MTNQEVADRFLELLTGDFHQGHELALVNRKYRQVCEEIKAPITGGFENE